jgi:hypothetical protein
MKRLFAWVVLQIAGLSSGYENCRMFTIGSIQYCRGDGVRCYSLEVQG